MKPAQENGGRLFSNRHALKINDLMLLRVISNRRRRAGGL